MTLVSRLLLIHIHFGNIPNITSEYEWITVSSMLNSQETKACIQSPFISFETELFGIRLLPMLSDACLTWRRVKYFILFKVTQTKYFVYLNMGFLLHGKCYTMDIDFHSIPTFTWTHFPPWNFYMALYKPYCCTT